MFVLMSSGKVPVLHNEVVSESDYNEHIEGVTFMLLLLLNLSTVQGEQWSVF